MLDRSLGKVIARAKPQDGPYSLFDFIHLMEEATERLQANQATPQTFRLLNVAFSMLKGIFLGEDPQALHNILLFYFEFTSRSATLLDLGRVFVSYCAELATTVLGKSHPVAMIFRQLSAMDLGNGRECIRRGYHYMQEQFIANIGVMDPTSVSYELVSLRKVARTPAGDADSKLRGLGAAKYELQKHDNPVARCMLWWVHFQIAETHLDDTKEYALARKYLQEIDEATLGPGVRLLTLLRLAETGLGLRDSGKALQDLSAAMPLRKRKSEVIRVLGLLERTHMMSRDEAALAGVQDHTEMIINDLEEGARTMWNGFA